MTMMGRMAWSKGNFGDLLTHDVLRWAYGDINVINCPDGPRILTVGSVAQRGSSGDILAGVGFKTGSANLSRLEDTVIWGLRGPLSLEVAAKLGASTSTLRFLGDPGLLVSRMWPTQPGEEKRGWVVVPHYGHYKTLMSLVSHYPELRVISPDQNPSDVARELRTSEGVISSSLHGIIFAHSYGIPAIALASSEAIEDFKYRDYAQSVKWELKFSPNLREALSMRLHAVAPDVDPVAREIQFPPWELLTKMAIAEEGN